MLNSHIDNIKKYIFTFINITISIISIYIISYLNFLIITKEDISFMMLPLIIVIGFISGLMFSYLIFYVILSLFRQNSNRIFALTKKPHLILHSLWLTIPFNLINLPHVSKYISIIVFFAYLFILHRSLLKNRESIDEEFKTKAKNFLFQFKQNKRLIFKLLIICLLIFLFILIKTAWVCDDAYISFRTADNLIKGYGLTWNVNERVQTYTNPLWMFVVAGVYSLTGEMYYTVIFLSIAITILVMIIYFRLVHKKGFAYFLLGFAVLLVSKNFTDYSTSGLENPLSYLIVILFLSVYLSENRTQFKTRIFCLSLLMSFSMVNRMDTVLLLLPALIYEYFSSKHYIRNFILICLGSIPFVGWEVFSTIYYGFPFPNTYYAKLNTHIPLYKYIIKGIYYIIDSLILRDQIGTTALFVGIIIPFRKRDYRKIALSIGIILYLLYIVRAGGDFMSGRFLTIPILMAVVIITTSSIKFIKPHKLKKYSAYIYLILLVGTLNPFSPILSWTDYHFPIGNEGIMDERGWYYQETGLLKRMQGKPLTSFDWIEDALNAKKEAQSLPDGKLKAIVRGSVGFIGFYAGQKVYIIDNQAITSPLLSRLPYLNKNKVYWRIGHIERYVPPGYRQTIENGRNLFIDKDLAKYYDKLNTIISGDVLSEERFKVMWDFNRGKYNHFINKEFYKNPFTLTNEDVIAHWKRTLSPIEINQPYSINDYHHIGLISWYREPKNVKWVKKFNSKILFFMDDERAYDSDVYYIKLKGNVMKPQTIRLSLNGIIIKDIRMNNIGELEQKVGIKKEYLDRLGENVLDIKILCVLKKKYEPDNFLSISEIGIYNN